MKKSVYRNFYYIKENISSFFRCNKKYLFFGMLFISLGIIFGLFVGMSNKSSFTFVNCHDKCVLSLLCKESAFWFLLRQFFRDIFVIFLILVLTNFPFVCFLNYLVFAYLTFRLIIDCIIFSSMLNFTGCLFAIFYFALKILIIFMFLIIFMICKSSSDCASNKFFHYPFKAILLICAIILILTLILMLISIIFSKFVIIII